MSQPAPYTYDENTEGTLSCIAIGIPPVTLYWQFEGANITDGSSYTISNSFKLNSDVYLTNGCLIFASLQSSDTGLYTCIGIGSSISTDISLTVQCKCIHYSYPVILILLSLL